MPSVPARGTRNRSPGPARQVFRGTVRAGPRILPGIVEEVTRMGRRARKNRARKKRKANHGRRPAAG